MELYKFIDENRVKKYNGGFIVLGNRIYTNPTAATIKKAGYKPLASVELPEYDADNEYIMTTYEDGKKEITPIYTVCEMENFNYNMQ